MKNTSSPIFKRSLAVFGLLALFACAIVFKIFQIQILEGDQWREKAKSQSATYKNIEAVRGNIYAEDGSLLATSVPIYEVRMDLKTEALTDEIFDQNIDSLSQSLAELFKDRSAFEWKIRLTEARERGDRYHLIKRKVRYNELKSLREFPIFNRGRYKGGLIYLQQNKREKPFKVLAARTIGYAREGIKPVGLEGAYNEQLSGVSGKRLMQKIAGGVWMPLNDENEIEPIDGADLLTTIDINIQDVAEKALERQLSMHQADHGCVVLMEVATGEVKAIANLSRTKLGEYYEIYNYAVGESTEPGSTFKLASYLAALEDGYIKLSDSIDTEKGRHRFYDTDMYDSHEGGFGKITVKNAFEVSSNIAVAKIITEHYGKQPQKFIDRLYKIGLNKPLGLEIYGEGSPQIKSTSSESWSGISLPWMSHGYEVTMTPLQILTLYNAVANDGVMVKPRFVKEIRRMGKVQKRLEPEVLNKQICSEKTLNELKAMLEGVVENGTARNLKNAHFKIAGKTGTAQIANAKYGYKYKSRVSYQASFAGYFPADDPKYSCIVVVNAPSRNVYYGNLVAGPIFKEIADKVYATSVDIHDEVQNVQLADRPKIPVSKNSHTRDLEYVFNELRIPYEFRSADGTWAQTVTQNEKVEIYRRKVLPGLVPNVLGMNIQDALYILENHGLEVEIKGSGTVKKQSLRAGQNFNKGQHIRIELS
jgi:cell division protein FtsI (penicillin-binding protein 3)